ncbi:UNVERIFIED_CONTAM: hypothetical protein HDU68_001780, partial [Siphonaria sp. JEL0065]
MNRTLSPGGCLNIALGSVDPASGPLAFTFTSIPQLRNATVVNGTTTFVFPEFATLTLVHYWSDAYNTTDLSTFSNTACTVPQYSDPRDLGSSLVSTYNGQLEVIPTINVGTDTVLYSAAIKYNVGCPYPADSSKKGPLNYYIQLWGQSANQKVGDANSPWKPIPFALPFPQLGLYSSINPQTAIVQGGDSGSGVKAGVTCPTKSTATSTSTATSKPTTTGSASGVKKRVQHQMTEKHEELNADGKKPLKMEEAVHVEVADDISPELEALLHTEPLHGLTDAQVAERTAQFGLNEIPETKSNPFLKFLSYFLGPISYLLEIACILSGIFEHWADFGILLGVLIINACIGFFEEARAESALDALKNTLALKSRTWRNGKLVEVDSNTLVPGDVIALRLGDIIPADCRLLGVGVQGEESEGTLQIDQAALTGESLPVNKGKGATAYSSAIVKQGRVSGRAANLISITTEEGHFQKIINSIGNFLVVITLVMAVILFLIRVWGRPSNPEDPLLTRIKHSLMEVLVLTIAAIPVGLPTIMSVTMAVGASQLAKKEVIVKRLTAIEELASVSILCSDKTGTLTLNKLSFDVPYLSNKGNTTDNFEGTGI